jgi:hypothetical protein
MASSASLNTNAIAACACFTSRYARKKEQRGIANGETEHSDAA